MVIFFGWVCFLISLGSPHVRPMGRTCGEPIEIELTAIGVELNGCPRNRLSAAAIETPSLTVAFPAHEKER